MFNRTIFAASSFLVTAAAASGLALTQIAAAPLATTAAAPALLSEVVPPLFPASSYAPAKPVEALRPVAACSSQTWPYIAPDCLAAAPGSKPAPRKVTRTITAAR